MALTWTDWRGHDYTVGDTILYARLAGRSCEMAEGVIEDLAYYYKDERYRWTRLKDGDKLPEKQAWRYRNLETGELSECGYGGWRDREGFDKVQVMVPVENEKRAKVMPTMRTSRFHSYEARRTRWVYDAENRTGEFVDTGPRKAITLRVTESITAIVP
jgi:hypothetical protein